MKNIKFTVMICVLWAVPTEASQGELMQSIGVQHEQYVIEGNSVAPFGYVDGDFVHIQVRTPGVDEMIAFACMHVACKGKYIKKLTDREGDCYWVEGRRDIWVGVDGRQKYSVDSTSTFGWLCGEQIEVFGVVEKT